MAAKGKLRTRDKLVAIGVSSDCNCALCNQGTKDCHHLFFRCPFSKMVCHGLMQWLGIRSSGIERVYTQWKKWGRNHGSKRRQKIGYATLAAVVYEVWRARNSVVWNLKVPCREAAVRRIQRTVCSMVQHQVTSKWSREDIEWLEKLATEAN
ncbi:uncharacterized protein LOC125498881 [Beta vulgaris subsp. vulgaris]|uniref:uncharacterized protein LOC125498881 n=1 Tax=Beta vulgaris subsp. vulgaris TaxID=3555 RepID=UPI0020373593|nr:uncharacterized protein LOC125498881 [Beta vulgaris subsp. vulgaris]